MKLKKVALIFLGIVAGSAVLYGSYRFTKYASYEIWYKDMVRDSIREMVKPEALKGS